MATLFKLQFSARLQGERPTTFVVDLYRQGAGSSHPKRGWACDHGVAKLMRNFPTNSRRCQTQPERAVWESMLFKVVSLRDWLLVRSVSEAAQFTAELQKVATAGVERIAQQPGLTFGVLGSARVYATAEAQLHWGHPCRTNVVTARFILASADKATIAHSGISSAVARTALSADGRKITFAELCSPAGAILSLDPHSDIEAVIEGIRLASQELEGLLLEARTEPPCALVSS